MKKKVCIPVSGGETSAYMALKLRDSIGADVDTIYPFANTGQEREETLEFVKLLETKYELPVVWLEAVVHKNKRKSSTHRVVNFKTACRDGSLFEDICEEYGLPNPNFFHCTRELKENPILSYCRDIGWGKPPQFLRALGIRSDEIDRVSPNYKLNGLYYPLAFDWQITKPHINDFWRGQEERLNLKGWQGNCTWCYKKDHRKHARLIIDDPEIYDVPRMLERKYKHVKPKDGEVERKLFRAKKGALDKQGLNVDELFDYCATLIPWERDDSDNYQVQDDLFSGCQSDCAPFQDEAE